MHLRVEVSSNAKIDSSCSVGCLLRVLVNFDGQQNSKIWQIHISKILSTCRTLDIYCWPHLVFNHQKNAPNKFPEIIFIKFPNSLCLPRSLLISILLKNQFINLPQILLPIPWIQLDCMLQIRIPAYSRSRTPTFLFFKKIYIWILIVHLLCSSHFPI